LRVDKNSNRVIRGENDCRDFIKGYFENERKVDEYD